MRSPAHCSWCDRPCGPRSPRLTASGVPVCGACVAAASPWERSCLLNLGHTDAAIDAVAIAHAAHRAELDAWCQRQEQAERVAEEVRAMRAGLAPQPQKAPWWRRLVGRL